MLNLVYGSMFLLRGLFGALFRVTIGLIGFVSDSAPSSSHSSMAFSYMDVPFYGSITLRMNTRRLSVIHFVFSFRVTVISYYLLRGVLW